MTVEVHASLFPMCREGPGDKAIRCMTKKSHILDTFLLRVMIMSDQYFFCRIVLISRTLRFVHVVQINF